ncbi:tetratricopeptide repeat protein [candidate division GN15 bacterium]|nr:tetratricopeptide repeat protein [candidate division GN15 bacterium]
MALYCESHLCWRQMMKNILLTACAAAVLLLAGCGSEPTSVEELKRAGVQAFLNEDYESARDYLLKGLQKAPSDRELLYFTGVSYKRDSRYDSALVYLNRAAILHKDDAEVARERLDVALALDQSDIAISSIRTLIDTGDPPQEYYLMLADLWKMEGWPINHYIYLKRYLDTNPQDSTRYVEFANASITVDSAEVGHEYLDSAMERFGPKTVYQAAKAVLYGSQQEYGRAERILRRLIAEDTGLVDLKLNLANVLTGQPELDKQREAKELLNEIKPYVEGYFPVDSVLERIQQRIDTLSG